MYLTLHSSVIYCVLVYPNRIPSAINSEMVKVSNCSVSPLLNVVHNMFQTYRPANLGNRKTLTLLDVKSHICSFLTAVRCSMSEVCNILKILMVMPATNAVSERSASALRQVKTYLRTTMSQAHLNNLMLLHIHKVELTSCA